MYAIVNFENGPYLHLDPMFIHESKILEYLGLAAKHRSRTEMPWNALHYTPLFSGPIYDAAYSLELPHGCVQCRSPFIPVQTSLIITFSLSHALILPSNVKDHFHSQHLSTHISFSSSTFHPFLLIIIQKSIYPNIYYLKFCFFWIGKIIIDDWCFRLDISCRTLEIIIFLHYSLTSQTYSWY